MDRSLAEGTVPGTPTGLTRASSIPRPASKSRRRDGNRMNMKRMRGRGHRPGGGGGGGGAHPAPRRWRRRRDSAQSQPRVRQQRSRPAHPRHVAAVVREIPPARPRRDQRRRPGDGGELLPARRALFPHPECDEPGGAAERAANGQQQAGQRRSYGEDGSQPRERGGRPRAPGTGDQPEAREIPIAAAPPEA